MKFDQLGLSEAILQAIQGMGFTEPTPIQQKAIPLLLSGDKDIIALAQTGTGKTAAFGLPLLQLVDPNKNQIQGLVLCPTRELCMQITQELERFATKIPNLKILSVYGGVSIEQQIKTLRKTVHIVVGTPGRVIDHLNRRTMDLSNVSYVVLDEADEMLSMGFSEDIHTILAKTPKTKRIWLFSATMPSEIEELAQEFMGKPERIVAGTRGATAQNLEHQYCVVKATDIYEALKRFLDFYPNMFGILFCQTKADVRQVTQKLVKDGYRVDALHGDLSQMQRDIVMKKFRSKAIDLLVATDVAARGIDVSDVTHVIHYELPDDMESYTHRSGRTARAGKAGISIALLTVRDLRRIPHLERTIKQSMQYVQVPSGQDICNQQLTTLMGKIEQTPEVKEWEYLLEPFKDFLSSISTNQLALRCANILLHSNLSSFLQAPNLNVDLTKREHVQSRNNVHEKVRLFINLGTLDGFDKKQFLAFLSSASGVATDNISSLMLKPQFAFINVTENDARQIIMSLTGKEYQQRKIRIERSEEKQQRGGGGSRGGGQRYRGGRDRGGRGGSSDRFGNRKPRR